MSKYLVALVLCSALLLPQRAFASSQLFFLEVQGIAGYDFSAKEARYATFNDEAEMQTSSLGFDYLRRLSNDEGDYGAFALQFRLAAKSRGEQLDTLEPQIYNAWFKYKAGVGDLWVGHNRPALGLGSYFDSHGLILRTLPIQGFGYDRDWGVGLYRDLAWGNLQLTLTSGTGMPVLFEGGNHMAAGRVGYGVLNRDNYSLGLSVGTGRTLDTMGYELRPPNMGDGGSGEARPLQLLIGELDGAWLLDNWEHRVDLLYGRWLGEETLTAMYRLGYLLDSEGTMKIELQPTYWKRYFDEISIYSIWPGNPDYDIIRKTSSFDENLLLSISFTDLVTSNLTTRLMYEYDCALKDNRIFLQLYYYRPL